MKKKLIEVALPLDAINAAASREKSIRHGHPSTLHLWWARRPLAACRAVLFAQLVDDPSSHPDRFPTEKDQDDERKRLFEIIERLVKWENSNNERVLAEAREEIRKSCGGHIPPVHDPFSGGGSIPLEAQRLGLEARGSDLNPVAVLIGKAMIEIPPRFAGRPPVHPDANPRSHWERAEGLAEDVRLYGQWMRDEAYRRIGHLYPRVDLPEEHGGGKATVIAWLWARTVASPNPVLGGAHVPLVKSFELSRKGKRTWVEPVIDEREQSYTFFIRTGEGDVPKGTVGRNGARCLLSDIAIPLSYIRDQAKQGKMSQRLMAVVAEGSRGRIYLPPDPVSETAAAQAKPSWEPQTKLPEKALGFRIQGYGITSHADLFSQRQSVALTTFSGLIDEFRQMVIGNSKTKEKLEIDQKGLSQGGEGLAAYKEAISIYLSLAIDKAADYWSSFCSWNILRGLIRNTFGRQAMPMVWDFAECNPFSNSTGNWMAHVNWVWKVIEKLPTGKQGFIDQWDIIEDPYQDTQPMITTDPPYYDNIGYADLSDFFYIWMRKNLRPIFPQLFRTMLVPKTPELIAEPNRHGGRQNAEAFFLEGMSRAMGTMATACNKNFPCALFYAFKQNETDAGGTSSTGWETFLEAIIKAGFSISGTWPMRTEFKGRVRNFESNALATSIVLVCRKRTEDAPMATRADFINALRAELPQALRSLVHGNLAPVDLPQASIGPGMAVFSRYSQVLESNGEPLNVRTALQLINAEVDHFFSEQESAYDEDTRFALTWYQQYGYGEGPFGVAESLATARNISVDGVVRAGIAKSGKGLVRILRREELEEDWDPRLDKRLSIWEATQHLCKLLEKGEAKAARLMGALGENAALVHDLAYHLYKICERKGWAEDARAYNLLAVSWNGIAELREEEPVQGQLDLGME
jgi:putative DNA methylase